MTFALPAALLIHLQANAGRWLPLADLAAHVALPAETVQQSLDELVARGEAHQAQRDGQLLYGAGVEGVAP
ncbi:MAG: hypothetical protein Q8R98_20855 [Rubrivivax sp.]|nr:hypothetical protein [Rubrivivax sp.]MDP3614299.1 hypothetical protein [Rubrivivax sp.]